MITNIPGYLLSLGIHFGINPDLLRFFEGLVVILFLCVSSYFTVALCLREDDREYRDYFGN